MGVMTLAEMRTELQEMYLRGRTDQAVTNTRLDRWINWGYDHVSHPLVHRHPQLLANFDFSLVTDDNTYDISDSATTFQITAVRSVTHYLATTIAATTIRRKLVPRGVRWFDERTNVSGPPTAYTIDENETLILSGVPTSTENGQQIRVRCWREPTLLAANGDLTVLPRRWDELVLLGARWRAYRDLEMREAAELAKIDFGITMNEFPNREHLEAEDTGWAPGLSSRGVMETSQ